MEIATEIQLLADGGQLGLAIGRCDAESVSLEVDDTGIDYYFADGSCSRVECNILRGEPQPDDDFTDRCV